MNILIIGGGNMGSAFAQGLMNHSSDILNRVTVHDINAEKIEILKKLEIDVTSTLSEKIVSSADIIILAVKPHNFPELLLKLKKFLQKNILKKNVLIISIAAGISITTIEKALMEPISVGAVKSQDDMMASNASLSSNTVMTDGAVISPNDMAHSNATLSPCAVMSPKIIMSPRESTRKKIVRVMPNTPALIGEGMSAWFATDAVTQDERQLVRQILRALGEEIEIRDESLMDAVTALSGCGPAYTFLFLESLIEGAAELGLDKNTAAFLALKTVEGSIKLARSSSDDLETLRRRVASPGGTTEAALQHFEKCGFRDIIKSAMKKAYERGKIIGKKTKNSASF
ncbi:pyrroline-5-carboxylate reductase [Candidatus Peregrinibacteria bacterium]|nr:pyrroline-5-carboxylate reductase [Candidatus Peregrinibacteria bacterium]